MSKFPNWTKFVGEVVPAVFKSAGVLTLATLPTPATPLVPINILCFDIPLIWGNFDRLCTFSVAKGGCAPLVRHASSDVSQTFSLRRLCRNVRRPSYDHRGALAIYLRPPVVPKLLSRRRLLARCALSYDASNQERPSPVRCLISRTFLPHRICRNTRRPSSKFWVGSPWPTHFFVRTDFQIEIEK